MLTFSLFTPRFLPTSLIGRSLLVVLAMAFATGAVAPARGAVLYDTTGSSSSVSSLFYRNNQSVGFSFQTTADAFTLTKLTFLVRRNTAAGVAADGNLSVKLWDSTGMNSRPGSQIGSDLGGFALSGIGTLSFEPLVVDGLAIALSPLTNYYATVTLTGNTGDQTNHVFETQVSSSPSGIRTGSLGVSQDVGAGWVDPVGSLYLLGSAEAVSAVPEPATVSLVACAGGIVFLAYRKRVQRHRRGQAATAREGLVGSAATGHSRER